MVYVHDIIMHGFVFHCNRKTHFIAMEISFFKIHKTLINRHWIISCRRTYHSCQNHFFFFSLLIVVKSLFVATITLGNRISTDYTQYPVEDEKRLNSFGQILNYSILRAVRCDLRWICIGPQAIEMNCILSFMKIAKTVTFSCAYWMGSIRNLIAI